MRFAKLATMMCIMVFAAALWAQTDSVTTAAAQTAAQTTPAPVETAKSWFFLNGVALAFIGGTLAATLSGIGSAIGIGLAGGMTLGALQEKPDMFGRFLPLAAAPGTQGIYGIVVFFLILGKITPALTIDAGWGLLFAGLPVGLAGLLSAIWQGKVCAGGIGLVVKDESGFGKGLVMAALVEFYAILGLLASIFMVGAVK